jgi:hypothetical protein
MHGWFKFLMVLIIGVFILCGCQQPTRKYKLITSTPDVWAHEPQQKVEFIVEWQQ